MDQELNGSFIYVNLRIIWGYLGGGGGLLTKGLRNKGPATAQRRNPRLHPLLRFSDP